MNLKKLIYRLGARPKAGSIFYSPSLAWQYAYKDYKLADAFEEGYAKTLRLMKEVADGSGATSTKEDRAGGISPD